MPPERDSLIKIRCTNERNQILNFYNRKMMSIIVENMMNNELILYCKGADSAILPLLKNQNSAVLSETRNIITDYAKNGLRTLILAKRTLKFEEYFLWKKQYDVNIYTELFYFFHVFSI